MGINRERSNAYLKTVRGKPCLICGLESSAHHLTFAQPRGLGIKTGDQFTVPLCHTHHMDLHQSPMPERTWWALHGIDPMKWVKWNREQWEKNNGDYSEPEPASPARPTGSSTKSIHRIVNVDLPTDDQLVSVSGDLGDGGNRVLPANRRFLYRKRAE